MEKKFGVEPMEKLLKQFMNETKNQVGAETADRPQFERRRIPVHRLKLVRDGSVRYDVPRAGLTSPEHCLGIFRNHFRGAPGEMVSVLAVNSQNQFIDVIPVSYGTLRYVNVTNRMIFAPLIGELNAAAFIVAHNHLGDNATPSTEDLTLIPYIENGGIQMECPMLDFMIVAAESDHYYSYREAMAEAAAKTAPPMPSVVPSKSTSEWVDGAK